MCVCAFERLHTALTQRKIKDKPLWCTAHESATNTVQYHGSTGRAYALGCVILLLVFDHCCAISETIAHL